MSTTAPRLLWHASRADINRPTINGRTTGDNHNNSGLGIYCATKPMDYICGFGDTVHQLSICDDARVLRMTIKELANLGRDESRQWFEQEGRRLATRYDIIELVEITGIAEQAIVLADEAITACIKLTREQYLDIALDHGVYTRTLSSRPRGIA